MTQFDEPLKLVVEAALLAAGRPLTLDQLCDLYVTAPPDSAEAKTERDAVRKPVREAIREIQGDCAARGVELVEVASGYRFQVKPSLAPRVSHLWATRPTRYSRALLETLALIAYRQPITRGEIENIRGVSVSSQIIANMLEYGWIRIVGHRNTPGHPKLYGTTKGFLDQFGLQSLKDLPSLPEVRELFPGGESAALEGEAIAVQGVLSLESGQLPALFAASGAEVKTQAVPPPDGDTPWPDTEEAGAVSQASPDEAHTPEALPDTEPAPPPEET